jgi:hypothetical protein
MFQKNTIMNSSFRMTAALAVSVMASALVPTLKADELNKTTKIKIDQSISIQGTVLPPGSYVIKLLGSLDDRRAGELALGRDF